MINFEILQYLLSVASSNFSNHFDLNYKSSYFNLTIQNPVCTGLIYFTETLDDLWDRMKRQLLTPIA